MNRLRSTGLLLDRIDWLTRARYSCNRYRASLSSTMNNNPVEFSIRNKLEATFQPSHLEILNESGMHNVPKGSETHFKVIIVSEKFINQSLINRHRLVNETLDNELKSGVHALSIVAKTPDQWESSNKTVEKSPQCRGGFGQ